MSIENLLGAVGVGAGPTINADSGVTHTLTDLQKDSGLNDQMYINSDLVKCGVVLAFQIDGLLYQKYLQTIIVHTLLSTMKKYTIS